MKFNRMRLLFSVLLLLIISVANAELNDPTQPVTFQEATQKHCSRGNMLLQSISYAQNKQVALINGNFYEIGSQVGLYKIIAITSNTVSLQKENEITILTL